MARLVMTLAAALMALQPDDARGAMHLATFDRAAYEAAIGSGPRIDEQMETFDEVGTRVLEGPLRLDSIEIGAASRCASFCSTPAGVFQTEPGILYSGYVGRTLVRWNRGSGALRFGVGLSLAATGSGGLAPVPSFVSIEAYQRDPATGFIGRVAHLSANIDAGFIFAGFISDGYLDSVQIELRDRSGRRYLALDEIHFFAVTPLPAGLPLLAAAIGSLALSAARWRRGTPPDRYWSGRMPR